MSLVPNELKQGKQRKAIWYLLHHGHAQSSVISRNEWLKQHNAGAVEGQEQLETSTIFLKLKSALSSNRQLEDSKKQKKQKRRTAARKDAAPMLCGQAYNDWSLGQSSSQTENRTRTPLNTTASPN